MKKIERRALLCKLLALLLSAGRLVVVVRWCVSGGRWAAEQYRWTRINDHDHSFYRSGPETRTAVLVAARAAAG